MRLLFIADSNASNAIVWLEYFANELGHKVGVIALRPPKREIRNVVIHDLSTRTKLGYFGRIPALRRLVHTLAPDVLIGYRVQSFGFLAASTGYRPLALAAQCETVVWPPDSRLYALLCRFALRRADLVNSWSDRMTESLVRLGARPDSVSTYPRGVKTEVFYPPPEDAPESDGMAVITTRGLAPEYHQDAVIRAMAGVRDRMLRRVRYRILGEGEMRPSLELLSRNLGLEDRIEFPGFVPHSGVADHLREAQVYVSLVSTDGVSASLLEAMACGVFPIVPDIPANRLWVRDGENGFLLPVRDWKQDRVRGFLAPPQDVTPLTERIVRALQDNELRSRARRINLAVVLERACWRTNMARMESAYRDLANRWKARPTAGHSVRGEESHGIDGETGAGGNRQSGVGRVSARSAVSPC